MSDDNSIVQQLPQKRDVGVEKSCGGDSIPLLTAVRMAVGVTIGDTLSTVGCGPSIATNSTQRGQYRSWALFSETYCAILCVIVPLVTAAVYFANT